MNRDLLLRYLGALPLLAACSSGTHFKDPNEIEPSGENTVKLSGGVDPEITDAVGVQALRVEADGTQTLLTEAELGEDGNYLLEVPHDELRLVVSAVDTDGASVAAAVLGGTGAAGGELTAPPLDKETTLEAGLFVAIVGAGTPPEEVDVLDLRLRVDAAVADGVAAEGDPDAAVTTLALALASAQATLVAGYHGIADPDLSAASLLTAEIEAGVAYDASLDAGDDPDDAASALLDALIEARAELGVGEERAWESETLAGVALRLVTKSGLRGTEAGDAVLVASGPIEARLTANYLGEIADDVGDSGASDAASAAVESLEDDTWGAEDASSTGRAWDDFRAAVIGPSESDTVLTGALGETDAAAATSLARAALTAGDTLDDTAGLAVASSLDAPAAPVAVSEAVRGVWDAYLTEIDTAVTATLPDATDTENTTSVLVLGAGCFRAGG